MNLVTDTLALINLICLLIGDSIYQQQLLKLQQ